MRASAAGWGEEARGREMSHSSHLHRFGIGTKALFWNWTWLRFSGPITISVWACRGNAFFTFQAYLWMSKKCINVQITNALLILFRGGRRTG